MSRRDRLRAWWAHAFAVESPEEFVSADRQLVERLARFVVRRRMTAPVLMVLETGRPLNFIGSQCLAFLAPFLTLIFSRTEYDRFVRLLDKRKSVDLIIDAIVEGENGHRG